jgi:hypothetical protein
MTLYAPNLLHVAQSFLGSFPHFIEPEVHYRVHRNPTLVHVMGKLSSVQKLTLISLTSILISSYLRAGFVSGLWRSDIPTQILY